MDNKDRIIKLLPIFHKQEMLILLKTQLIKKELKIEVILVKRELMNQILFKRYQFTIKDNLIQKRDLLVVLILIKHICNTNLKELKCQLILKLKLSEKEIKL